MFKKCQDSLLQPLLCFCKTLELLSVSVPIYLLNALRTLKPTNPILHKLLNPWFQLRLHQAKVVHRANPQNRLSRKARPDSVHQRATITTEVVGHGVAFADDGFCRRIFAEFVLAADVAQRGVVHDEIGGEHGRGDFVAVRAVTNEAVDQVGAFGGLWRIES